LLLIWMERHGRKYRSHMVMKSPSMKPRVSCVYVLLIFILWLSFQSRTLKTMIVIDGHWSIWWPCWRYLDRTILNLVMRFAMRSTEWLQFTLNGIWFFLLGRTEHCLHMTWSTEKFMSSLHGSSAVLDLPRVYVSTDLTIFLMVPCSCSHEQSSKGAFVVFYLFR
jgi:hypothetical protein